VNNIRRGRSGRKWLSCVELKGRWLPTFSNGVEELFSLKNVNRQVAVVVAMILIPCLALGYFIFYENIRTRIEDEKKKNVELAKATTQYIDTYIRNIKFTLAYFCQQRIHLDKDEKTREFLRNLTFRDDAEKYFVLNSRGEELVSYPQTTKTINIPKQLLQKVTINNTIVELLNAGEDPAKIVIVSCVRDWQGKIKGYTGAVISMGKIARDFANIKVSNNGYVIMTDRIGQVLVHPDSALLRKRIPPEKMKNDPIYQAASRGVPGAIEIVAPFDKKKKLFAYAPSRETGWIVYLVEPETDLQVVVTENLTRNSVVFILVLVSVFSLYQYLRLVLQRAAQQEAVRAEKLALVGQLAAGMAHEIRNPLTAIKGFLQMLQGEETDPKKQRYQDIMMSEIERIEEIITETLLLAKPQKQKVDEFTLDSLVRQVLPVISAEATMRNIVLNVDISPEPLLISGDPNHTKQALLNIIKNAIEASEDGGTVTVEAFGKGNSAFIQVTDKGSGIDPKDMEKVGTPFFTTKEAGTGLGLTVTHRIVESMGGKLEFSSRPGQGTIVTISFPLIN